MSESMIRSFNDQDTRRFFEGHRITAFQKFAAQAARCLILLDSAEAFRDLPALPSNRLETLRGDRTGRHGIRIDEQWRVCFHWTDDGPCDVEIVDHHRRGANMNARNGMRPVHPGEVLREELDTLGLSANALAKALSVPVNRVTMILNGQRGVSADTALRPARYFGTTPQLWLNLQKTRELRRAEVETGREIAERVTPRQSAA